MEDLGRAISSAPAGGGVPEGVDPRSWIEFEQQIRERRFRALLDSGRASADAGDFMALQTALEEARELRPDAPELAELEATALARPLMMPPAAGSRLPWSRAAGAMLLLVTGVAMNMGVELLRPAARATIMPSIAAPAPAPPPVVEPSPPVEVDEPPAPEPAPEMPALVARPEVPRRTANVTTPRPSAVEPRTSSASAVEPRTSDTRRVTTNLLRSSQPSALAPLFSPAEPVERITVPTEVVSRAAPPAAPPITPAESDESSVADVLRRYAQAYGELDARAAREVWPSVDARALARAFDNLRSQNLSFEECQIDILGTTANATCRGLASYVGRVGGGEKHTEPRAWQFELVRDRDGWKIKHAEAHRLSVTSSH